MDSDNDSAIWRTFFLSICALAIVAGVAACGAPVINSSGLSWDNSIWTTAQTERTKREQIQADRDVKVAQEWNATMQTVGTTALQVGAVCVGLWTASKALPAIVASIAGAFAAWAARPHRPQQRIEVHLSYDDAMRLARPHLAAIPDASVEWVDDVDGNPVNSWAVVSPSMRLIKPLQLTDSQHIN